MSTDTNSTTASTSKTTPLKNPFKAEFDAEANVFRPWGVTLPGVDMRLTGYSKRADAVAAKNALNAWHAAGGDQDLAIDVATFIDRYHEYVEAKNVGTRVSIPWIVKHSRELIKAMREVVRQDTGR